MRQALELGDEPRERSGAQRARAARRGAAPSRYIDGDLADERLGRGDADLQAGARVEHAVGVARGLRAHDVGDRQHRGAALARQAHRRQRVGRLAGLRDADDEVAGADHRVAVAVLRGDVHLDRDPRPLLDRVAADQAGVVGGAAGDDRRCRSDVAQDVVVERARLVEVDAVARATVRSAIVSATASACSWISLSMNVS